MHRNVNDAAQDGEYLVVCFKALLKLKEFVPEGMGKEVEANTIGCPLEESRRGR